MVEVGMNEERRLSGLAGDDDEDNMREDRDAMFGLSLTIPSALTTLMIHLHLPWTETAPSAHIPLPLLFGMTMKNYSRTSMVRRSSMELGACIALRSTLLSLEVVLVTFPGILQFALRSVKRVTCLSLKSLLILMVVCIVGNTVLWLVILN
jgi:hypothetical protein